MIKSYAGQMTERYSFSNFNLDNNKRKDSAGSNVSYDRRSFDPLDLFQIDKVPILFFVSYLDIIHTIT